MVSKSIPGTAPHSKAIDIVSHERQSKEPGKRGAHRVIKDGRARTISISCVFWERTPPPKSAFLRDAIDLYLMSPEIQPERRRATNGVFLPREPENKGKIACVYLPDDQWEKLAELSGAIANHVNAALRRALERRE